MIGQLTGALALKSAEQLIVDVNGVGYLVTVSLNTFYKLPEAGAAVQLLVHTHVREDALQLFGFFDRAEKELFLLLTSVSGIGPRLAMSILSGTPTQDLLEALDSGDLARLVAIPGIGKKTAERLVVELRDKIKSLRGATASEPGRSLGGQEDEAVSALVNLGYKRADAERAVKAAVAGGATGLEAILRAALKRVAS